MDDMDLLSILDGDAKGSMNCNLLELEVDAH